jgi:VWFA-related protein
MPSARTLLRAALLFALLSAFPLLSQSTPEPAPTPTFRSTASLVFLDVAVLDAKGRVVTSGLTQDDFTITEDKQPQRIFSFEAPQSHDRDEHGAGGDQDNDVPLAVLVLDQLNSSMEDFAFLRDSVERYLRSQPSTLASPTELMVAGNRSSELVQSFTRNRDDLLFALKHVRAALPYKLTAISSWFDEDRFTQSVQTLQAIALQTKGLYTHKNVLWIGYGGPKFNLSFVRGSKSDEKAAHYIRSVVNMLVDARITLFQIYPGSITIRDAAASDSRVKTGKDDPFGGDINFGTFVNETGGKLFDKNNADQQIAKSIQFGAEYYTLTYQPHGAAAYASQDGAFRSVQVSLRDPSLRAVTKFGYYSPDKSSPVGAQQNAIIDVSNAAQASIPFDGLAVKFDNVARHPDSRTVQFTVLVETKNLDWELAENGASKVNLLLAAVCSSPTQQMLASKLQGESFTVTSQDPVALANQTLRVTMTVRLPGDTRNLRVAVQGEDGGRIGAADLARKTIDAAPKTPTPAPAVVPRRGS